MCQRHLEHLGNLALVDLALVDLIVDLDVLERNIARMAARARSAGVRLRPHVKTHKCVEVARLQAGHGIAGLTVSTLPEARAFSVRYASTPAEGTLSIRARRICWHVM